jgi:hypothetical protein
MVAEPAATPFDVKANGGSSEAGLDELVRRVVQAPDIDAMLREEPNFFPSLMARLTYELAAGFERGNERALRQIHRALYFLYEQNFAAPTAIDAANQFHPFLMRVRNEIERRWEAFEKTRARIAEDDVPADPAAFSQFFKERCFAHLLARHPLFDFLELKAGRDDLIDFFRSDSALALRFCDLVTMTMVGADEEVRGELAVNLWDEMGNGDPSLRHAKLFRRLLAYVGADRGAQPGPGESFVDSLEWQGLAGYNLHLFLSIHRSNYFKSVGCLGSSELMDGPQYAKLLRGLRRVGIDDQQQLAYYASHVEIDAVHGQNWIENVLVPLVVKYPEMRGQIVVGAAMRLNITNDYFTSVLRKLTARARKPDASSRHEPLHLEHHGGGEHPGGR